VLIAARINLIIVTDVVWSTFSRNFTVSTHSKGFPVAASIKSAKVLTSCLRQSKERSHDLSSVSQVGSNTLGNIVKEISPVVAFI
jgi:hypothetical protein